MNASPPLKRVLPLHTAWLNRVVLLWSGCVALGLFTLLHARGFDDPYITYRYAQNLATGSSFVYNAGERVLSTTTPLYTLLLALFGLAGLDLPLVSNAIGCLSLAAGGLVFWRLGAVWRMPLVGLAGLLLYPAFPLLLTTLGAETALYITLILLGFLACEQQRYGAAALWLALATLTRADGVVATGMAGLYVLWQHWELEADAQGKRAFSGGIPAFVRALPWSALTVYLALLLPWFIFAWFYFGAPFPVTLAAKQQQGQMSISRSFLDGLVVQVRQNYWPNPFYRPYFVLAGVGLVYATLRARRWLLIPGWGLLYAAAYTALGVSSYFWYYGPLVPGFVALVALGIAALGEGVRLIAHRIAAPAWLNGIATLALIGLLLYPQMSALAFFSRSNDSRMDIYRQVGEWLRANTASDAAIGTLEVGIIGYYAQRRMVDFAGLIQPETARQLTPTTTYEDAAIWATERFQPDYLALQQGAFPRLEQLPALHSHCRLRETFRTAQFRYPMALYECRFPSSKEPLDYAHSSVGTP